MLWNVIQHCNVFVAILIALPNCIWQHVQCIWHIPYSMFVTLHRLTSHALKGYDTQKMHLICYGMGFNNAMYLQQFVAMQKQLPESDPSINCYFPAWI
jgi:fumarate reductase subunit D